MAGFENILRRGVGSIYRHPTRVVLLAMLALLISLAGSSEFLEFSAERSAMLHPRERYRLLDEAYHREFPGDDDLVVVIEGSTSHERELYVDELLEATRGDPQFEDVFGRTDLDFFRSRALTYLSEAQLRQVLRQNDNTRLQLAGDLVRELHQALQQGRPPHGELPLPAQLPERWRIFLQPDKYRYNALEGRPIHLVLVRPASHPAAAIKTLQGQLNRLRRAHPHLTVGLTGKPVIQADEVACARRDATRSTLASCVLVLILFRLSFSSLGAPLAVLLCLLSGIGWTLGLTTATLGHLNMLTLTFATMLVGLGADFGIHIVMAYQESRASGLEPLEAMQETMTHSGMENLVGAATSSLAFAAICYTDFLGVAELGAITSVGILLCFLAMSWLLPALLFLQKGSPQRLPVPAWVSPLAQVEAWLARRPRFCMVLYGLITASALWSAGRVSFDYNLLHLQDPRLPSVQTELRLVTAGRGVLAAICLAENEQKGRQLSRRLAQLESVDRVESVLLLLPEKKPPSAQQIMAARHKPLAQPFNRKALRQMVERGQASPDPKVRELAQRLQRELKGLQELAQRLGPGPVFDAARQMKEQLGGQLQFWQTLLSHQRVDPVQLANLPSSLRLRGVGRTDKLALRIYPKENLWDHEAMARFVHEVQGVDANASGAPISIYYHTLSLKRAYERSAWTALVAISLTLLVYFRCLKKTLLALLPKLVGVVWMLGWMGAWGMNFNPANFIALPMILGTGLVFGVHVVHRLLKDPHRGIFEQSAGPAVALSALATIIGFATLIGASHRGIASLGMLMSVGVTANLITSLALLPCLVRLLSPPPSEWGEEGSERARTGTHASRI